MTLSEVAPHAKWRITYAARMAFTPGPPKALYDSKQQPNHPSGYDESQVDEIVCRFGVFLYFWKIRKGNYETKIKILTRKEAARI